MAPAVDEKSNIPINVPPEAGPKPPRQRKPVPAPTTEPASKPRRIARRDNVNRAYYVCLVNDMGEISKMISKFPTVGQARKNRDMVTKAAGFAAGSSRIVRTVIVE